MAEDKIISWIQKKLSGNTNSAKSAATGTSATNISKNNQIKNMNKISTPHTGGHFLKQPQGPQARAAQHPATHSGTRTSQPHSSGSVRICPLGGLNEVGKNMMLFEYRGGTAAETDIVIIDMGFQFPEQDMLGIDYVVPDITYLLEKKQFIRGILLTHGHLDHIGAIPYLIEKLGYPPIYGTKLTMGFVKKRLDEFNLTRSAKAHIFHPDDTLRLGHFTANFFGVNHSIPDAVGIFLQSPAGNFVHTGDFKFDFTPAGDQKPAEFAKIASLANRNVLALFSDSTNALKPGQTMSEQKIAKNLEEIIKKTEGRIIITAFSSLIGRLQQILDFAQKYKRQVFLTGRSMLESMEIARNLGHLKYPNHLIHDIVKLKGVPDNRVMILTTGSQGEDVSALTRISLQDHPHVRIKKGDTVVISATPIIGNERAVTAVINNLCRQGAHVIHSKTVDVHTSGHACQEDLKLMITMVKPKYLVPVHGEYHMRVAHKELGLELGMKNENGLVIENGDILEAKNGTLRLLPEKAPTNYIMVDGLGMGDVGTQVIEERLNMSQNGVLILLMTLKNKKLVRDPEIISRGFIYMQESEKIMSELAKTAKETYRKILEKKSDSPRNEVKRYLRAALDKKTQQLIERRPLIIPIMVDGE